MKSEMLKIAGVKSEKEFYKKYPTEAAFKKAHPKAFKKAEMGASMVKKQLEQLTDFGNPPQAQNGFNFADALSGVQQNLAKSQQVTPDKSSAVDTMLGAMNTIDSSMGIGGGGMSADGMADMAKLIMRNGGQAIRFQGGGDLSTVGNTLKNIFTTPGKAATATSAATPASGGLGDTMKGIFGQDPAAFGKANPNGALGKGGQGFGAGAKEAGFSAFGIAPAILGGVQAMQNQKKAIKKADQASQISGVVAQAAESRPERVKNQYVRPEDQPAMGAMNPQGTGTNFLAAYGASIGGNPTEIQNTYNPGDLYSDLGYEPLNDSNVKQFAHGGNLPTAEFGDYFQDSGQAQIGGATGEALGTAFFGPIGGKVGKLVGNVAGNLLGGAADANKLARFQDTTRRNTERATMQQGAQSIQGANAAFMENGGWMNPEYNPQMIAKFGDYSIKQLLQPPHDADMLRAGGHLKEYTPPSEEAMYTGTGYMEYGGQMAMGGDLQVHRGKAEPISYNPFLPEGGETVMFKGPSHDNGGMPISYGQNGVEVEGGEPAVKLADGGSPDGNLVVFGNMKIDDMAANHIGVEAAKGKKYKRFIDDLSKFESRQNNVVDKATDLVNSANTNDPFEQLSMNSGKAMMMGANAKLLNAAIIKQRAAGVQNAILDTAKEYGVKSDQLAQGKFVKDKSIGKAAFGAKMEAAQDGYYFDKDTRQMELDSQYLPTETPSSINQAYTSPVTSSYITGIDPLGRYAGPEEVFTDVTKGKNKSKSKFDWKGLAESAMSNVAPLFRPTNQEALDPSQLYPEMYALATNQLEPVRAQQFQPMLKEAYNISLQDQLNEVDAQARAATRQIGANPAAAAQIFAAATDAKNKIRGEQMRVNQAQQAGVRNENIAALNQAQMQNLQILDQQYGRQAEAKSKTKAQALEALKSIASKTAQSKLENRQLGIMENMYNYRFGPKGQAYNINDPYRFNTQGAASAKGGAGQLEEGYEDLFNAAGRRVGTRKSSKDDTTSRNGSIVKALKTL